MTGTVDLHVFVLVRVSVMVISVVHGVESSSPLDSPGKGTVISKVVDSVTVTITSGVPTVEVDGVLAAVRELVEEEVGVMGISMVLSPIVMHETETAGPAALLVARTVVNLTMLALWQGDESEILTLQMLAML